MCPYCNREHRSLLEPDGGDSCDAFAKPDVFALPIDRKRVEALVKKACKPRKQAA